MAGHDALIRETRARREALHQSILRMQHDRRVWERDSAELVERGRLTQVQRQCLQARLSAGRRDGR